jgi:hypothetical protein
VQEKVSKVRCIRRKGTLKSGSGRKVKSRKQAIAIGLSEPRKKGAKVPKKGAKKLVKRQGKRAGKHPANGHKN